MQKIKAYAALGWAGFRVDDVYGANIGTVEAPLVDRETGELVWLHVRLKGFVSRHVALPAQEITAGSGRLHLPYEREHVLRGPRVPATGRLSARHEHELCVFYDLEHTRGARGAAWERRTTACRLTAPGVWEPGPRSPEAAQVAAAIAAAQPSQQDGHIRS